MFPFDDVIIISDTKTFRLKSRKLSALRTEKRGSDNNNPDVYEFKSSSSAESGDDFRYPLVGAMRSLPKLVYLKLENF